MSELIGCYNAFGYQPATQEPCDHVAVEVGFIGYLRLKEAYAQACQDPTRAEATADEARRLIEDHRAAIVEPLATTLEKSASAILRLPAKLFFGGPVRTGDKHEIKMEIFHPRYPPHRVWLAPSVRPIRRRPSEVVGFRTLAL
jgi:hypothetical protein